MRRQVRVVVERDDRGRLRGRLDPPGKLEARHLQALGEGREAVWELLQPVEQAEREEAERLGEPAENWRDLDPALTFAYGELCWAMGIQQDEKPFAGRETYVALYRRAWKFVCDGYES